ncbi:Bifunctional uridylyltransferase/uridylyl-removing enzyme [uncultured archaeon]|nr:Bifunctional uridylyltransferase/uridylyl-removing enzyme [uncultured archaeon]
MDITKLLINFNRTKEQIRNKTRFRAPAKKSDGLTMAIAYSNVMEYVVKELFNLTREAMGLKNSEGMGAFLYGSPGRKEMVAESDLDVMLLYEDDSQIYHRFKDNFKEYAKSLQFCKVDLPEWGTIDEASIFAQKSITEGNQVLESNFVCGDEKVRIATEKIQQKFGGPERMIRNIAFQKFYFDQYFEQRVRDGNINVKYCDGGSRDYLFINWFNQLMNRKYSDWDKGLKERPVTEIGLSNLYHNGLINSLEFAKAIESLNFNILLRNEILLANKGTSDEGLTFLDKKTLISVYERVPELMKEYYIDSPEDLKRTFDNQRNHITSIKKLIWDLMIDERGKETGSSEWAKDFHKAYFTSTPEKDRESLIGYNDSLMRIATIWGATNSNQKKLFNNICKKEKNSDSWEIQASLVTSPICSSEYLHHIAEGIGKEKGYGYILRIISRNPNVKIETLETIANDYSVEQRYTQCAKSALEHGKESANHQI